MTVNIASHVDNIVNLACAAGAVIMPYYKEALDIREKADMSPVTIADRASEELILTGLSQLTPDIPIVAEELAEEGLAPSIAGHDTYWLVDPLDGTKEFIKGSPDFTVNIGLVHHGKPVLGVVYIPATDDLYHGGEGIGAYLNGKAIKAKQYIEKDGLTLVGSRLHPNPDKQSLRDKFLKEHKVSNYAMRGSSLKFCLIADGTAHLYPRFVPTYEWDTCAAHAILLQAGGEILDFKTQKRLAYGKDNFLNGHLVTATNEVLKILKPFPS